MKLITKSLEQALASYPIYSQEKEDDPIVSVKLFDPSGSATWFLTEYDPEEQQAFGYVIGLGSDEFGYIPLTELETVKGQFGLGIERDLHFEPKRLSECAPSFKQRLDSNSK